jgi:hypothetical protein
MRIGRMKRVVVKNVIQRSFGFAGNSRSRFASSKQIEFWIAFCCRSAFYQESSAGRSTHISLVGISGAVVDSKSFPYATR